MNYDPLHPINRRRDLSFLIEGGLGEAVHPPTVWGDVCRILEEVWTPAQIQRREEMAEDAQIRREQQEFQRSERERQEQEYIARMIEYIARMIEEQNSQEAINGSAHYNTNMSSSSPYSNAFAYISSNHHHPTEQTRFNSTAQPTSVSQMVAPHTHDDISPDWMQESYYGLHLPYPSIYHHAPPSSNTRIHDEEARLSRQPIDRQTESVQQYDRENTQDNRESIQRTQRESQGAAECVVCMSESRNMVLFPCRHMCLCEGCCSRVLSDRRQCPLCRMEVTDTVKVYL